MALGYPNRCPDPGCRMCYGAGSLYTNNYLTVDPSYFDSMTYTYRMSYGMGVMSPLPRETKCGKCGGAHSGASDNHGFCKSQQETFWKKVRKLYWHRYSKERANY